MNSNTKALAAVLFSASLCSMAGTARAIPLGASLALREAPPSTLETVQWRGGGFRGGWGGGWRGGGWGGGWRGGGWGGFGLGLAAGAIIGGAVAAPYYGYDYGYYPYGYAPAYYGGGYYGYGPYYRRYRPWGPWW
jgi:hypothetical protein